MSALFSALGFSSVIPTVARFVATDLEGGDLEIGLALGVFSISAVLARPWIGRIGDRRGRRLLIAGGSSITALVLAAHALADSYLALLVARFIMGAVQGAFFVGTVTLTTDLAPAERRGEAASYFSVAIYGGMAFGPWLGELAVARWGFDGGFLLGGLCMGVAAVVEVKLRLELLALPTTKFVVEEKAFVRVWILMCRMTPHVLFGQSRNVPWGQRLSLIHI